MRLLFSIAIVAASVALAAGCGGAHPHAPSTRTASISTASTPTASTPTASIRAASIRAAGTRTASTRTASTRTATPTVCAQPAPGCPNLQRSSAHERDLRPGPPQILVTDERQDLLAIVDLRSGRSRAFIGIPGGPQYVAARPGLALVTSPNTGAVTLLKGMPLRVVKSFRAFGAPHIVQLSPDGRYAYVTDDARGTLTVIRLSDERLASALDVGPQPHHTAASPNQSQVWIALGESAREIVVVDTSDVHRPRVIGRLNPGFPAHDLAFSPDGRRVWISSSGGPDVAVFRASDRRLLFHVPVGPPPQHIAFSGGYAYLTSGYGSTIEQVSASTGRVIRRARAPYGSFELDAAGGSVATASLLDGKLAIYTATLRLRHVVKIGPGTRDVAISDG